MSNPETTFLITGATGATGGAAAAQLLDKKRRVRVLAHREDDRSRRLAKFGAEVVFGDLLDFDAMRAALNGVQPAYFGYPIRRGIVQAIAQFAQVAKEGRRRVHREHVAEIRARDAMRRASDR